MAPGRPPAIDLNGPWRFRGRKLQDAAEQSVSTARPQVRAAIEAVPELIAIIEESCRPLKIREAIDLMRRADAVLERIRRTKAEPAACLHPQPVGPPTRRQKAK